MQICHDAVMYILAISIPINCHQCSYIFPSTFSLCRRRFRRRHGILQHKDDGITTQEHLGDVTIFVDRLRLLSFARLRDLVPHFFHVLQHHVAVTVERFHATQKFAVVAAIDQNLGVVLHGGHEHGKWPCLELFLFALFQFLESEFRTGFVLKRCHCSLICVVR